MTSRTPSYSAVYKGMLQPMTSRTPNDLFDWREDGKTVVHDTHALRCCPHQTEKTTSKPPSANSRSIN